MHTISQQFNMLGIKTNFLSMLSGLYHAQTFGTLPDPFPSSSPVLIEAGNIPAILFRLSA